MNHPLGLGRRTLAGFVAITLMPAAARAAAPACGGSGSGLGILRILADDHARAGGASIDLLPSLGSAGGLAALRAGRLDLAIATQPPPATMLAAGYRMRPLARTPVVVATHAEAGVPALAAEAAGRLLAGSDRAWPGGAAVRPILRERTEREWVALREGLPRIAQVLGATGPGAGLVALSAQENLSAIAGIAGAIGVTTLGQVATDAAAVAVPSIDGVAPSPDALAAGAWRPALSLHLVWRDPAPAPIAAFLAHLDGPSAAGLLARHAYIPVEPTA
ncbi:substrate-binding domain-containing protein [Roseomonas sp. PWR1]|uniref:Substrate-binding domain-containing protein n=1 Tax=Roseomonas nitratireducens TaxID=2820810 RepID=A0ABS4AUI9_9PROT|nr:substrate-binding domain-containing protein [Neoroseomonas nitratireducens]MBP0464456.1 substrate-binding domain-containing protein [Neoroseomonas nitratireducens]